MKQLDEPTMNRCKKRISPKGEILAKIHFSREKWQNDYSVTSSHQGNSMSKNRSESTDTEGVTEGQGASGVRSTGHKSPNIRSESEETPRRDSDQSLDKFTRCFEILTNTISAGFSGLKSDIAELATDHDDYIDEGDSDQSQGSHVIPWCKDDVTESQSNFNLWVSLV